MVERAGRWNWAARRPSAGERTLGAVLLLVVALGSAAVLIGAVAGVMFLLLGTGRAH